MTNNTALTVATKTSELIGSRAGEMIGANTVSERLRIMMELAQEAEVEESNTTDLLFDTGLTATMLMHEVNQTLNSGYFANTQHFNKWLCSNDFQEKYKHGSNTYYRATPKTVEDRLGKNSAFGKADVVRYSNAMIERVCTLLGTNK